MDLRHRHFSIIAFFGEQLINKRFVRGAVTQPVKAFISFWQENKEYQKLKSREPRQIDTERFTSQEQGEVLLLIIGESCNRNHMSLYGYNRKTTPRLDARKDIIVYNDVISGHSYTISSVLSMLTESNLDNRKNVDESLSVSDVFRSAGYKTYWLSNQSPLGVWDNALYNMAKTFDVAHFTNNVNNSSFESTLYSPYDEVLIDPITKVLKDEAPKKLIVVQLMGNHSAYHKRYPSGFKMYTKGSNKRENVINAYDNSILYNDFIIDSILTLFSAYSHKNPNLLGSVIYLSDHGENVYDDGNNAGHDYSETLPNPIMEIPFIVWVSEKYKIHFKEKFTCIEDRRDVPFTIDDLFFTLLDLSHIHYPAMDYSRALFNPEFNASRLRIMENGEIYKQ